MSTNRETKIKKSFDSLFKIPTKEELQQMKIDRYERHKKNPNNFSYWYEAINSDMKREFLIPLTKYAVIPLEIMECLWTDGRPQEAIDKIQLYLEEEFKDILEVATELFMKTGTFSNKFEYNEYCHVTDKSQLGEKLYGMYYVGMIYGAVDTVEVVLRAYIPNTDSTPTIYGGMPLRTEYRVFYDFDNHKVLDVINYWHPEVMTEGLLNNFDSNLSSMPYEQILSLKDSLFEAIQQLPEHQRDYKLQKLTDYLTYKEYESTLVESFNANKDLVRNRVEHALRKNHNLQGKWSIDIMQNGDLFYFIDAAEMRSSALANFVQVED